MFVYFVKILVSFLVIINPVQVVPVYLELTSNDTVDEQRKIAIKATVLAAMILFFFAILGDWLITQLEITTTALLVAGGILLFIFALQRVLGGGGTTANEKLEAQHKRDVAVFPLAVPMIAGPGALTVVMFQVKQAEGDLLSQVILFFALSLVLATNGVMLYHANRVGRALGVTGTNVVTRVFGIILAAIAIQLILNGITDFLKVQRVMSTIGSV